MLIQINWKLGVFSNMKKPLKKLFHKILTIPDFSFRIKFCIGRLQIRFKLVEPHIQFAKQDNNYLIHDKVKEKWDKQCIICDKVLLIHIRNNQNQNKNHIMHVSNTNTLECIIRIHYRLITKRDSYMLILIKFQFISKLIDNKYETY